MRELWVKLNTSFEVAGWCVTLEGLPVSRTKYSATEIMDATI